MAAVDLGEVGADRVEVDAGLASSVVGATSAAVRKTRACSSNTVSPTATPRVPDDAADLCRDDVLHLHGLHDEQRPTDGHLVARTDVDADDRALQRGPHRHHRGGRPTVGWSATAPPRRSLSFLVGAHDRPTLAVAPARLRPRRSGERHRQTDPHQGRGGQRGPPTRTPTRTYWRALTGVPIRAMVACQSRVDSAPVTHRVGPMFTPSSTAQTRSRWMSRAGRATSSAGRLLSRLAPSTATTNASSSPPGPLTPSSVPTPRWLEAAVASTPSERANAAARRGHRGATGRPP